MFICNVRSEIVSGQVVNVVPSYANEIKIRKEIQKQHALQLQVAEISRKLRWKNDLFPVPPHIIHQLHPYVEKIQSLLSSNIPEVSLHIFRNINFPLF